MPDRKEGREITPDKKVRPNIDSDRIRSLKSRLKDAIQAAEDRWEKTFRQRAADAQASGKYRSDGQVSSSWIKERLDAKMVSFLDPSSIEAECFKLLRSIIFFPPSGKVPRSILVTSSAPGEGKSFVAANMAISIAQSINDHVLLVDCDLRRPQLDEIFALEKVCGLSEYLSIGAPLSEVLYRVGIEKLTILPGGNPPDNPAELLSSRKMKKLMEELVARYDDRTVIFDSPPPMLVSETTVLARQVDAVLVVIEYGNTARESILEMVEMIGRDKIIGFIMNKTPKKMLRYSGKLKYDRYSGSEFY
jgi:protein-tyrosine kinase